MRMFLLFVVLLSTVIDYYECILNRKLFFFVKRSHHLFLTLTVLLMIWVVWPICRTLIPVWCRKANRQQGVQHIPPEKRSSSRFEVPNPLCIFYRQHANLMIAMYRCLLQIFLWVPNVRTVYWHWVLLSIFDGLTLVNLQYLFRSALLSCHRVLSF